MEKLYYFVSCKLMKTRNQSKFWLWVYRRIVVVREIDKHIRRGNWRMVWRYLLIL